MEEEDLLRPQGEGGDAAAGVHPLLRADNGPQGRPLAGGVGAHHAGVPAQHLHPLQAAAEGAVLPGEEALGPDAHGDRAFRHPGHGEHVLLP